VSVLLTLCATPNDSSPSAAIFCAWISCSRLSFVADVRLGDHVETLASRSRVAVVGN
jgi:hypothetical protein